MGHRVLLVGCGRMGGALLTGWLAAGSAGRVDVVEPSADQVQSSGTIIANDTRFKGTITCRDQILIAGIVEGDIDCGGIVWVARKGRIYANVYARKVIVEGEIYGNIESAEYVELRSEGRLIGDLKAAKIRMAPGCYFDGEVMMQR